jgi:tRNA-uridine 2-sulfurtransferase
MNIHRTLTLDNTLQMSASVKNAENINRQKSDSASLINEALLKVAENNVLPSEGSVIGIAMSGGVDSSVAAALLSRMNYKVFGITGWLMEGAGKCCDGGMLDSARIAETVNIEHHSIDLRDYFNSIIIKPFVSSYSVGRTPVPCMPCNTEVKWGSLLQSSGELGANYLASGHYARLLKDESGRYCIGRSRDLSKDQSYMLWGLNQQQLQKTVFPLANFNKQEIRALAKAFELGNWDKEESQDICFIPNKTKDFLSEKLGQKPGEIQHVQSKKVLGQHTGTHFFTIGQRKGIGLSNADPLYVVKLDPLNNIVYVGEREDLFSKSLVASNANWQLERKEPFMARVKIRYNSEACFARVSPQDQAAVIYDESNQMVIGGAWIDKAIL